MFKSFRSTLYNKELCEYTKEVALRKVEAPLKTILSVALKFVAKGNFAKTCFTPRKLGQDALWSLSEWETTIAGHRLTTPLSML